MLKFEAEDMAKSDVYRLNTRLRENVLVKWDMLVVNTLI